MGIAVNGPKSPVTEGSSGVAIATLPNICKMPGPPAPFVPTPLPNIGKSDNSPQGYSTSVTFEGKAVAIQGATFNSTGDVASQGTGGGLISSNVQGPTSFIGPGSMDVKIEGKNVQLLSDQMLNNGGPSGSPPNAATMGGVVQAPGAPGADAGPPQTGSLKVTVTDVCTGDPVAGVLISSSDYANPKANNTDSSGIVTLTQLPVGQAGVEASKDFPDANYSTFIVQYPRLMWKGTARSSASGTGDVPAGGTGDVAIKIVVYRLVAKIVFRRLHLSVSNFVKGTGDAWGHWWTEIDDSSSYGWWPKYPVGSSDNASSPPPSPPAPLPPDAGAMDSIQNMFDSAVYRARSALYKMKESALGQTLRGVEGELNGQTSFGGTPTQDPHHGTGSQEDYQPVVNDCTPDQAAKDKIAAFAAGYSGGWSWRFEFGNHCHTFQKALMDECGYDKYKIIK